MNLETTTAPPELIKAHEFYHTIYFDGTKPLSSKKKLFYEDKYWNKSPLKPEITFKLFLHNLRLIFPKSQGQIEKLLFEKIVLDFCRDPKPKSTIPHQALSGFVPFLLHHPEFKNKTTSEIHDSLTVEKIQFDLLYAPDLIIKFQPAEAQNAFFDCHLTFLTPWQIFKSNFFYRNPETLLVNVFENQDELHLKILAEVKNQALGSILERMIDAKPGCDTDRESQSFLQLIALLVDKKILVISK